MTSFYRMGYSLHSPIPSMRCLDAPGNDGRTIRLRVARALSEGSYPHEDRDYYTPFTECEACAILGDSLRLLASLENV